jgi:predicted nuclease of predicted toxin-antitoxin system
MQLGSPRNARSSWLTDEGAGRDYVVITHDLDFSAILAVTRGDRPSVVQIRADDLGPERIGYRVIAALAQARPELERGALLAIDVHRTRLRMLPLTSSS